MIIPDNCKNIIDYVNRNDDGTEPFEMSLETCCEMNRKAMMDLDFSEFNYEDSIWMQWEKLLRFMGRKIKIV